MDSDAPVPPELGGTPEPPEAAGGSAPPGDAAFGADDGYDDEPAFGGGDSEPLLSSEESSALLDAMGGSRKGPMAEPADLAAPERHLRNALRRGDQTAQDLARHLGRHMLQQLGTSVLLQELPAEIAPYTLVSSTVSPGSIVAPLVTPRSPFAGVIVVGPLLTAFYLDRRLGAPIREDAAELHPRSDLGSVDRRLAQPLVKQFAEELGVRWCERRTAFRAEQVLRTPDDLPERPPVEPVLRLTVRTSFGPHSDEIVVVLTPAAVRDTIPDELPEPPRIPAAADTRHLGRRVATTAVEAVALLGSSKSTVREILALEKDDIVRLDTAPDSPTPVWVDGIPVLRGHPVVSHGNLAIEVTDVI